MDEIEKLSINISPFSQPAEYRVKYGKLGSYLALLRDTPLMRVLSIILDTAIQAS